MGILDHPSSSAGSQSGPPRGTFGVDWSKWFPPVTSRSFLAHYLPASGAVSHTLYTVHLFSPNIISSMFSTGDLAVSNTILFNANVGLGFYVYFRRHLHRVNPWERVEFSVLATTLFNFGSLLAAVLIKALLPAKSPTWLKSVTATVLSGYLLSRAYKYLGLVDTRSSHRPSVSPARSVRSVRTVRPVADSSPPPVVTPSASPPMTTSLQQVLMTPSATEHSASDFGEEEQPSQSRQNFRYLHSYALNNLNHPTRPNKETILRRTTLNEKQKTSLEPQFTAVRRPSEAVQPVCFVTPEPSLKELEVGIYTPPPSRARMVKTRKEKKEHKEEKKVHYNERDEWDRVIDLVQWHAPLALVPFAFGCVVTGTVPMYSTIRFIFA